MLFAVHAVRHRSAKRHKAVKPIDVALVTTLPGLDRRGRCPRAVLRRARTLEAQQEWTALLNSGKAWGLMSRDYLKSTKATRQLVIFLSSPVRSDATPAGP